jgi:hypothetical protein
MQFVGIDPGKEGAIAWMDGERKHIEVHDCPLLPSGGFDHGSMLKLIWRARRVEAGTETIFTMEEVHAMPNDGRCSAFSFGRAYEAWIALLGAAGETPRFVSPQIWKRTMLAGIANDRRAEAVALKQRFQGHPICSQLHGPRGGIRDGRVDALFLAEYGRLIWRLGGRREGNV